MAEKSSPFTLPPSPFPTVTVSEKLAPLVRGNLQQAVGEIDCVQKGFFNHGTRGKLGAD